MPKITFEREDLLQKLNKAKAFVPKKAVLSAHDTFLFRITGKEAFITSTDGQKQVTLYCETLKTDGDCMFTVPAKLVLHVLNLLLESEVTFTVKEKKLSDNTITFNVEVKSGKSKYNMPSDSGNEYPLIQTIKADFEASFNGSSFNKAMEVAKSYCDPENASPALQGVCLRSGQNNNINVFGCTGQHAAKIIMQPRSINKWDDIIIPVSALTAFSKVIPDDAIVDIIHDKDRIEIVSDGVSIKAICFNCKYPDADIFFRSREESKIELNTVQFLHALQRLDVFSPKEFPLISMDIKTTSMAIETSDEMFNHDGQEIIDVVAEKEIKIGVNQKFLTNIIESFTNDSFNMFYFEFDKPIRIEPVDMIKDNDMFFVVMPIKI